MSKKTAGQDGVVIVAGLGEVGRPLLDVLSSTYRCVGKDLEPLAVREPVGVLHVCYPYRGEEFVRTTADYVHELRPALTIIHSTVVPGTTRAVEAAAKQPVVYSPVRGKHVKMRAELRSYTKFVAGADAAAARSAAKHLAAAGMSTELFGTPEALELAKLLETTYFGLLIAWAQEMERYCAGSGATYDEVMQFTREIDYLPPVVFRPGFIGGHCVMPNANLLEQVRPSAFVAAMRASNEQKRRELESAGTSLEGRLAPTRARSGRGGRV